MRKIALPLETPPLRPPATLRRGLSLVALLFCGIFPAKAAVINNVDFGAVYDGTGLPNAATPAWALNGSSGTAVSSSGIFQLDTTAAGVRYYQMDSSGDWNGSTATGTLGSTIEFRLKVDSLASGATAGAAVLYFSSGTKGYVFYFFETEVISRNPGNGTHYAFDTKTDFNTYRITLSGNGGGLASLYINGSTTPAISNYAGDTAATNLIYFGDGGGSTGGATQWDYLAFTNQGAFAPVPEPGMAGYALMGVALLGWAARRKGSRA